MTPASKAEAEALASIPIFDVVIPEVDAETLVIVAATEGGTWNHPGFVSRDWTAPEGDRIPLQPFLEALDEDGWFLRACTSNVAHYEKPDSEVPDASWSVLLAVRQPDHVAVRADPQFSPVPAVDIDCTLEIPGLEDLSS